MTYTPNQAGMLSFLNSDMLLDVTSRVADEIKVAAIALSPIGNPIDGDSHPGLYISSFSVRSHKYGGATNDRAESIVTNNSPDAVWVEFGHHGREPYHVLRNAAFGVSLL